MADPRQFVLNSDYPTDKIACYFSQQYTVPSMDARDFTIPNTLPFRPLIFGYWATNPDFNNPHSINDINYVTADKITVEVWSRDDSIWVDIFNETGAEVTVYLRLFGFEPSNSAAEVPSTVLDANKFIMNTEYNYLKLYSAGVVDISQGNARIDHNLGYKPQILAWRETPRSTAETETGLIAEALDGDGVFVSDSSVFFDNYPTPNSKIHYRIYADEA